MPKSDAALVTDGTRIYDKDDVRVGDVIAYVGARIMGRARSYPEARPRDWLAVTRIDKYGVHGFRVHPQEWERDVEFVVVDRQITQNGVVRR